MIFLDTGFLFAFVSDDDASHVKVRAIMAEHRGQRLRDLLVTTNHVIGETITLLGARGPGGIPGRHARAVKVGEWLFSGSLAQIHQVTADEERAAFDLFRRHDDQQYSFVDCVSFVIMQDRGIQVAWSVDKHFTHSFTALPGPPRSR